MKLIFQIAASTTLAVLLIGCDANKNSDATAAALAKQRDCTDSTTGASEELTVWLNDHIDTANVLRDHGTFTATISNAVWDGENCKANGSVSFKKRNGTTLTAPSFTMLFNVTDGAGATPHVVFDEEFVLNYGDGPYNAAGWLLRRAAEQSD